MKTQKEVITFKKETLSLAEWRICLDDGKNQTTWL